MERRRGGEPACAARSMTLALTRPLEDTALLDAVSAAPADDRTVLVGLEDGVAFDERFAAGGGAKLAILDSGIDLLHPDLAAKVEGGASYLTGLGVGLDGSGQDNNFHGTYVAGIAAAITDDEGIAGVGFDADLLVYRVCTLLCLTADSAAAMIAAAEEGAQVANDSFGGAAPSETARLAVEFADEAGVLQVASSGNDGQADAGGSTVAFPVGIASNGGGPPEGRGPNR